MMHARLPVHGIKSAPRLAMPAVAAMAVFVGGAAVTMPLLLDISPAATLFGWLLALYTLVSGWPLVARILKGTFNPFELPVWTAVEQWLRMGLLSMVFFLSPGEWLDPIFGGDLSWLNLAVFYCVIATPFLWFGYNAGRFISNRLRARDRCTTIGVRVPIAVSVYAVVVVTRVYLLRMGVFGYLASVNEAVVAQITSFQQLFHLLEVASVLPLLALLVHRVRFGGDTIPLRLLFYSMLAVEIAFRVIFGSKGQIALLFLMLGVANYVLRRRFRSFVVVGALLLIFVVPLNLEYRLAILEGRVDTTDIFSIVSTIGDIAAGQLESGGKIAETVGAGISITAMYSAQLQYVAAIMQYVEQIGGLQWGRAWLDIPAVFAIPQALWPDKPVYPFDGVWMTREVMNRPEFSYATGVPMQGDFYLHFGLAGMVGGMFLIGVIQRILFEQYWKVDVSKAALCYPLVLLAVGPAFTVAGIVGLVRLLVMLFLVERVLLVRRPSAG